ncbi:MAG: pore-forming ESAT-6 family protein [Erysipelotrichaceae bacterium]|nr:pore-forming ESAT-6 family protein [Erysipelotrichaceae bacterium]
MDNIKISLNEVASCAQSLRLLNERMYEKLQIIKKDINDLNNTWISDGGETIRNRFNIFANRFEVQKDTIESYSKFLDLTVSSYDLMETSINANASSFNN